MSGVRVLLGVDCDRPRTPFRDTPTYQSELDRVMAYIEMFVERWSDVGARWTMFLCGQFVEALQETSSSADDVRRVLGADVDGCEFACHSYAHKPIAPVAGRNELAPASLAEIERDLDRNTVVLNGVAELSARFGFRSPYGHDLRDLPDRVVELLVSRRAYSSSALRTRDGGVCPPLSRERQPFEHRTGFWELPGHGWHDTVFAGMSPTSNSPLGLTAHRYYSDLIRDARELANHTDAPIFVGLVLHPIAMASYDPSATLLEALCDAAGDPGAFVSYGDAANELSGRTLKDGS